MQKDNLIETSKLIFNCLSEYYSIFGSKKKMLSLITKELQNKSGETYKSIKKCIKKKIVGILFYYDYDEFSARTLSSNLNLNSNLNNLKKIFQFSKKIQKVKKKCSFYISRFSIDENFKNKGIGSNLIKKLCKIVKNKKKKFILLHVNNKNIQAVKFYKKNNFDFLKKNNKYEYNIMYKRV